MANEQTKVEANLDGLNKLLKGLKSDYFVRVGIIGSQAGAKHKKTDLTNAELGNIHEQPNNDGKKIPKRSFLEMPLKLKLNFKENEDTMKAIKKGFWKAFFIGSFNKDAAKQFYAQLGAKALDIIIGAFETNGYGNWVPWSKAYERRRINKVKGKRKREQFWLNHNILTDTGQLRRSISFKVMKNK